VPRTSTSASGCSGTGHAARIYVLSGGLHSHGIAEPQLSLMAWRSAVIVNDLADRPRYRLQDPRPPIQWSTREPGVPESDINVTTQLVRGRNR
jgi:lysine/ornithine N-monooxygenase